MLRPLFESFRGLNKQVYNIINNSSFSFLGEVVPWARWKPPLKGP